VRSALTQFKCARLRAPLRLALGAHPRRTRWGLRFLAAGCGTNGRSI
jgi:hypothetical protein